MSSDIDCVAHVLQEESESGPEKRMERKNRIGAFRTAVSCYFSSEFWVSMSVIGNGLLPLDWSQSTGRWGFTCRLFGNISRVLISIPWDGHDEQFRKTAASLTTRPCCTAVHNTPWGCVPTWFMALQWCPTNM